MDIPAVQLLCLEQGDHSLEDHTRDFIKLANLSTIPNCSLCIFFMKLASGCLRQVLEGVLPLLWSGCWRIMDCISPSVLLKEQFQPHSQTRDQQAIIPLEIISYVPVPPTSPESPLVLSSSPASPELPVTSDPASSINASLFLCPVSAGSCQYFSSPSFSAIWVL